MNKKTKVNNIAGKLSKELIEFCYGEKIINPKIDIDVIVSDGEHYRLVFERLDLDESTGNLFTLNTT